MGNVGKALLTRPQAKQQGKTDASATASASNAFVSGGSAASVAKPVPVSAKPQGKNFVQGMWEGIFAPKQTHAHGDFTLNNLQPRVVKKDLLPPEEKSPAIALQDISEKMDIQEVPAVAENAQSATGVDVDGDGIVDVRYHQR